MERKEKILRELKAALDQGKPEPVVSEESESLSRPMLELVPEPALGRWRALSGVALGVVAVLGGYLLWPDSNTYTPPSIVIVQPSLDDAQIAQQEKTQQSDPILDSWVFKD